MLSVEQKARVEKWLHILENGMHEQTTNKLKVIRDDGIPRYCCLGVAAEAVLGRQFKVLPQGVCEYVYDDGVYLESLSQEDKHQLGLHKHVTEEESYWLAEMLGVEKEDIERRFIDRETICMYMNDDLNLSFPEIAQVFKRMEWDVN